MLQMNARANLRDSSEGTLVEIRWLSCPREELGVNKGR